MHSKKQMSSSFLRLFSYIKLYKMKMFVAGLSTVLHNLFDILPDVLIGMAVDVVVNQQNSFIAHLGITNTISQLSILAGLVFIVSVLDAWSQYLSQVYWMQLAQVVQHDVRMAAYGHIQFLEMEYFEKRSTGDIVTVLNDDVNQLEYFFDKVIVDGIYFLVNIVMVGFIFCYLSPVIALLSFFPVPIILFITYKFQQRLGFLYSSVRFSASSLGARIATNILGIATIKIHTTERYELERLRKDSNAYKTSSNSAIEISAAFVPVIRVTVACGFVITIVLGGWYAVHGMLAVGSYSVLVSMTHRLLWPFIYLAKITDVYKRTMASVNRIFAIIDSPITLVDGTQEILVKDIQGKIEFKNVSFAYPDGENLFRNLSLRIDPGQTVGFVGSTGSGKTTLIKLLLRLYDPHQGSILLDDIVLKDIKMHFLRQLFGVVSQDVFLFKGTIRENIAYGILDITDEEIESAAKIAEIHNFIVSLPDGYNTIIGEHGQRLSGGQRQRLSIARAIVDKPAIFIFDEATSSVDNETEAAIQRSLNKIAKNNTVFIIAHRLSSVRFADTIFVLQNGTMAEVGKHEELILRNGAYAQLWHTQLGE